MREIGTENKSLLALYVFWGTVESLSKAFLLQLLGRVDKLNLPSYENKTVRTNANDNVESIICWIDRLQKLLIPKTKHRCFYRAYAGAVVLRKLGIPVKLNFGLRNLSNLRQITTRGHCWLTLDDSPLMEKTNLPEKYPFLLAQGGTGLCYWVGSCDDTLIRRKKLKET